jgi:hypothetical protein
VRRSAKVDDNQGEIDAALRAMGWRVWPTHQLGKGFPDRIAIKAGRVVFIEVKDGKKKPSARKLTPAERVAHDEFAAFGVHVHVIEKVEDLAALDREARSVYERVPPREFYPS